MVYAQSQLNLNKTGKFIFTDKISNDYRIVFISDTHYGTVQNPAVLQELMAEIGTLEPDFIVLGGDWRRPDFGRQG